MESISTLSSGLRVDIHLAKFTQVCIVVLTAVAFIVQWPVLVLVVMLCMAISVVALAASPFRLLYKSIIVPLHVLQPRIVEDDPAPHRFAQGSGTLFLLAGTLVLFFTPAIALGWTLDLIVFVLAGINLTVGFCAGCFVYFHLGRLGILPKVRYEGSFHWRGV
ncbi:MAG: DUF4395 domain-containing protein [Ktedonobacteraceae bacterium]|nr:DUF4395 domain-containing protein [Ktedonobacteraceae bacterium]